MKELKIFIADLGEIESGDAKVQLTYGQQPLIVTQRQFDDFIYMITPKVCSNCDESIDKFISTGEICPKCYC